MIKKLLFMLLVLLGGATATMGALTYGASNYLTNKASALSGVYGVDPIYSFIYETESYLEGNSAIDDLLVTGTIGLLESTGATYYTYLQAGNQSGNLTYTLPIVAPTTGQYLSSTSSGVMSWGTPSATFTGGSITSDITLADDVDILPTTVITDTWAIKVYDTDAPGYLDVMRWTNATTPTIVLGAGTASFALASTGVDISTAGAISNVTTLDTSGNITSAATVQGATVTATGGATVGTTLGVTGAATFAGTVTLDDGSGASPSLVLTDETNQTATFSKVDGGNVTVTPGASTQSVQVLTGNLKVGNGTEDVTLNGEDAYVEGTLEVDAAARFDGAVTANSTLTVASDAAFSDQIAVTLGSNDEEITVTNTATDLTASALVTLIMAAQDNQAYILNLQQTPDADADNDFLLLEDNAGDDKFAINQGGTTVWTLDAASTVTIDGDTTANTSTTGVLDLNVQSATNGGTAQSITFQLEDNATTAYGIDIDVDDDTTGGETFYGLNVGNSAGTSATVVGINFENTINTGITATMAAAGVFATVDAATTDSTVATGVLDIDWDSVTNGAEAVNIKATQLTGGAGVADAAMEIELDSDSGNANDILYGLIINATDTTATGKVKGLYVKGAGMDAAIQLDTGYLRVGTGSTPGVTPSDDDVFIEGTLEVDGQVYLDYGKLGFANGVYIEGEENGLIELGDSDTEELQLIFGATANYVTFGSDTGVDTLDVNGVDSIIGLEALTGDNGQKIDFSHNELIEFGDTEKLGLIFSGTNVVELGTDTGVTTLDFNDVDNLTDIESIQYDDDALSKLMCVTVQLNAAEVNDLVGTPKQLVAAPGADYLVWPIEAILILDAGSEVLAESDDNLVIGWNNAAVAAGETIETTGFIDQAADTITNWHMAKDEINAAANVVNKNLAIKNDSGDFTGNASQDAAMTITIFYRIVKVGL